MGGRCQHCSADDATQQCGTCKAAKGKTYYCGRACQRADWKAHKRVCGLRTDAPATDGAASASASAEAETSTGSRLLEALRNAGAARAARPSEWWTGLSAERTRERFMQSFQLRNEDAYVFRADMIGPYNADSSRGRVRGEFVSYAGQARAKGLLPDVCDGAWLRSAYVREHVMYAVEKEDISAAHGALEPMVLRGMAEAITGEDIVPTGW